MEQEKTPRSELEDMGLLAHRSEYWRNAIDVVCHDGM